MMTRSQEIRTLAFWQLLGRTRVGNVGICISDLRFHEAIRFRIRILTVSYEDGLRMLNADDTAQHQPDRLQLRADLRCVVRRQLTVNVTQAPHVFMRMREPQLKGSISNLTLTFHPSDQTV